MTDVIDGRIYNFSAGPAIMPLPVLEKAREEMRAARESNDQVALKKLADQRKGLMDIRKSHLDKLRASLTDEQKTKLDKALANGPGRGPRGGPNGNGKPSTPPPSTPGPGATSRNVRPRNCSGCQTGLGPQKSYWLRRSPNARPSEYTVGCPWQ